MKRFLPKDEGCGIAAEVIHPCLICIKLVPFMLDDKKKGEKIRKKGKQLEIEVKNRSWNTVLPTMC